MSDEWLEAREKVERAISHIEEVAETVNDSRAQILYQAIRGLRHALDNLEEQTDD